MAWCRQATSHYLSQCWPRSVLPYDVTRPLWGVWEVLLYLHCSIHPGGGGQVIEMGFLEPASNMPWKRKKYDKLSMKLTLKFLAVGMSKGGHFFRLLSWYTLILVIAAYLKVYKYLQIWSSGTHDFQISFSDLTQLIGPCEMWKEFLEIIFQTHFMNWYRVFSMKLVLGECHRIQLMTSQHWFR